MSDQRMWHDCPHYEGVSCRFSGTECFPSGKREPCPFEQYDDAQEQEADDDRA